MEFEKARVFCAEIWRNIIKNKIMSFKTMSIKGLNFQPWISDNYLNNTGKYGQLLVIGESHYFENEEESEGNEELKENNNSDAYSEDNHFTSAVVELYINGEKDINFFRNLGLLFNSNDRYELWKNVAFANAIQVSLPKAESQPCSEAISTVIPAFWLLLKNLQPTRVLVCSKRMWNGWMPDNDERSSFIEKISSNEKHSTIWKYDYGTGSCLAMGIKHPSKFFSYTAWKEIVFDFLDRP